jgi:hypothetical protein
MWSVTIQKHVLKRVWKMPRREQEKLDALVRDLRAEGPVLPHWPNYSRLSPTRYHCHLSYKWVAFWVVEYDTLRLIEIYYAGSREDAPY